MNVSHLDFVGLYNAAVELVEMVRAQNGALGAIPALDPLPNRSEFERRTVAAASPSTAIERLSTLRKQAVDLGNALVLSRYATQGTTIDQSKNQPTIARLYAIADNCERIRMRLQMSQWNYERWSPFRLNRSHRLGSRLFNIDIQLR